MAELMSLSIQGTYSVLLSTRWTDIPVGGLRLGFTGILLLLSFILYFFPFRPLISELAERNSPHARK